MWGDEISGRITDRTPNAGLCGPARAAQLSLEEAAWPSLECRFPDGRALSGLCWLCGSLVNDILDAASLRNDSLRLVGLRRLCTPSSASPHFVPPQRFTATGMHSTGVCEAAQPGRAMCEQSRCPRSLPAHFRRGPRSRRGLHRNPQRSKRPVCSRLWTLVYGGLGGEWRAGSRILPLGNGESFHWGTASAGEALPQVEGEVALAQEIFTEGTCHWEARECVSVTRGRCFWVARASHLPRRRRRTTWS